MVNTLHKLFRGKLLLLFSLFLFGFPFSSKTEVISSELHYRWLSDSTFEFTYVTWIFIAPTLGNVPPDTFHFNVSSASLNINVNVNCGPNCLLDVAGTNTVPPELPDVLNCGTNAYLDSNRSLPFVNLTFQERVFRFQYTFPAQARDWIVSINRGNPGVSTNIKKGTSYAECGLNNLDFPDSVHQNISPLWMERRPNIPGYSNAKFINYPVISSCVNRTYILDQSVIEFDGDIIRYEIPHHGHYIDTALGSSGTTYAYGFTLDYKLPTDTPPMLQIDSISGEILFKPVKYQAPIFIPPSIQSPWNRNTTNIYSFPIMAREFRLDTTWIGGNPVVKRKQIGYITRFITAVVHPDSLCADSSTFFVDTTNRNKTTFIDLDCRDNPFKIGFNNPIRCSSIDTNGSSFSLINSISGDTVKIVKSEPICRHDDITDDIKIYLDSTLANGLYYLYLKQGDDGNSIITQCGSEVIIKDSLNVYANTGPGLKEFWSDSVGSSQNLIDLECGENMVTFFSSYQLSCQSIEHSGSDFIMVDSIGSVIKNIPFDSVKALNCFHGFGDKIRAYFSKNIDPGHYKIYLQVGSDGNTVIDKCHRRWIDENLEIVVPSPEINLGPDIEICSRDTINVTLSLPENGIGQWSTGEYRNSIVVNKYGKYWVKVYTDKGCLAEDTIELVEINCTGIEEFTSNEITIRPNPTVGYFQIIMDNFYSGQIQIYNSIGYKIFERTIEHQNNVEVEFPPLITGGVYIVRLTTYNNIFTQKVVLRRE